MKKSIRIALWVVGGLMLLAVAGSLGLGITPLALNLHDEVLQKNGVALDGSDVVSYFSGTRLDGSDKHSHSWQGAIWLFASNENLQTFLANPDAFIPEYGGHCTYAYSTGFAAPTDAKVWRVYKEKLYIFSNQTVEQKFESDPEKMIRKCNR